MLVNVLFFAILAVLFLGMVAMQIAGHHYGVRRASGDSGASSEGTAAVEATLFAMLGLLVAFTFSGADTRLDARRKLIIEETNAVGTAYLRLDLLRRRTSRSCRTRCGATSTRASRTTASSSTSGRRRPSAPTRISFSRRYRTDAVAASARAGDSRAALLVLQSLNAMFDVATERYAALRTHVPPAIFVLLLVMALACAVLCRNRDGEATSP